MKLNALNIRKGLELEVPVTDIFKVDTESYGDPRVMESYEIGIDNFAKKYGDLGKFIGNDYGMVYTTTKTKHKVGETIDAYICDSYVLWEESPDNFVTEKGTDIEFVNTKKLSLVEFFENLMKAQAFSGFHEANLLKYKFAGVGDFSMNDYLESHILASHSNMHFLDFFVLHKNVMSSIGFFMSGLYKNDIESQKEYLNSKEYKDIIMESNRQWKAVRKIVKDFGRQSKGL